MITKNGLVYQLNHDEGRVTYDYANSKWVYEYDYRDVWGNLRLSFRDSLVVGKPPVVTQIEDRDPTGVSLAGLSYANQNKTNFGFLNRETIAETGWIDLNNRFYDPFINRFHQIDPIIKGQENYSLYQYGYNNPVMNSDPNGDCPSCPQGADAAKVYAVGALVTNKDGAWTWTGTAWTGTDSNASSTVQSNSPDMADRWSSGSIGQQVAYGFADGLYSMFANNHLGGKGFESYDDKMKTKLGGLMTLGGPLLSEAKALQVAEGLVDDGVKAILRFGEGENQIQHAFRHADELGLDRNIVKSSIETHFNSVSSQIVSGKPFNQVIEVAGQKIQYTAFKLTDGTINIGRIHGIK